MLNSPAAIADFQTGREQLGIDGGMLIANPVPESDEIPARRWKSTSSARWTMPSATTSPARRSRPSCWHGIFRLTEGRSLETNIALVENNARLAAKIAVALAKYARSV